MENTPREVRRKIVEEEAYDRELLARHGMKDADAALKAAISSSAGTPQQYEERIFKAYKALEESHGTN